MHGLAGLQYRELLEGTGPEALFGSVCDISYVVYRLASGAYYKYSSGGTPVFLFSLGYGQVRTAPASRIRSRSAWRWACMRM